MITSIRDLKSSFLISLKEPMNSMGLQAILIEYNTQFYTNMFKQKAVNSVMAIYSDYVNQFL